MLDKLADRTKIIVTVSLKKHHESDLDLYPDADISINPYELGLDRLINPDMEADFIGKAALRSIRDNGVSRKQVGLRFHWPLLRSRES